MADGEWLTIPQVARYLGLSVSTVRRMVRGSKMVAVRDRRRGVRVVRRAYLDAWVRERRVKPGSLAHLDANRWPKYRVGDDGSPRTYP